MSTELCLEPRIPSPDRRSLATRADARCSLSSTDTRPASSLPWPPRAWERPQRAPGSPGSRASAPSCHRALHTRLGPRRQTPLWFHRWPQVLADCPEPVPPAEACASDATVPAASSEGEPWFLLSGAAGRQFPQRRRHSRGGTDVWKQVSSFS